jgi:hypothetical protein
VSALSEHREAVEIAVANVTGSLVGHPPDLGFFHELDSETSTFVIVTLLAVIRRITDLVGTEPVEAVVRTVGLAAAEAG